MEEEKKSNGGLARAIHRTLYSAGRLVSGTKRLKDVKPAVKLETVSENVKKAWDSAKQEAGKAGDRIQRAVKLEKVSTGAKKAWGGAKASVGKISQHTQDGMARISQSFQAGYRAVNGGERVGEAEERGVSSPEKVLTPAPGKKLNYGKGKKITKKPRSKTKLSSGKAPDQDLEKEIDQIVSDIAQI